MTTFSMTMVVFTGTTSVVFLFFILREMFDYISNNIKQRGE